MKPFLTVVRDGVNLSAKVVKDRYFPDKAFDIRDESLSQYSMERQRIANDPTYLSTLSPLNINYVEIQNTVAGIRRCTARARHTIEHTSGRALDQEMLYLTYFYGQKYLEENI